ncbi:MAG: tRNA pseudouridine(54/55) synthase Pus10 [Thermofilaceae archaeon]
MKGEELLSVARKVLAEHALCDSCLGRLFGMLGYGLTNAERGRAIKTVLLMESYDSMKGGADRAVLSRLADTGFKPAIETLARLGDLREVAQKCSLCGGVMERLDELAHMCLEASREYQFETFQVGCSLPSELVKHEEELWLRYRIESAESLKGELTREVGKRIATLTGKQYSLQNPDVVFLIDLGSWGVSVQARPLFIYGRYRKLVRGLPQSPWLYKPDSRVLYPTSIEELISKPLVALAKGSGAKLHAAGREDLDVRTLGSGRPFVAEILCPKVRTIDLREAERLINQEAGGLIEVEGLQFIDGRIVPKLKAYSEIARKTYVARVSISKKVNINDLELIEKSLKDAVITQKTPTRILGKKVDKIRKKVVYEVKAKMMEDNVIELIITCQGGLYVKELIHGDRGRTKPSVAEILNAVVEVEELDVVHIEEPAIVKQYLRSVG